MITIDKDKLRQIKINKELKELYQQNADMLIEIAILKINNTVQRISESSYKTKTWFNRIKLYYDNGVYNEEDLLIFINARMISEEDYNIIINK